MNGGTDDPDVRGGFILFGNQLSLDFLNTRLTRGAVPVELLTDLRSLSRWLSAAGVVSPESAREAADRWASLGGAKEFMTGLWAFRDRLRCAVLDFESGKLPDSAFITDVNDLLVENPVHDELHPVGNRLELRSRFHLEGPEDAYGPIARAAALLFVGDASRVRKCEACPGQFYDTSKKGARHWCSMRRCGNKVKVAAYARRRSRGAMSSG